jgi:anti-anti-sigma factor
MTDLCSPSAARGVVEEFDLRTRRPPVGVAVLEVVGEVDGLTAPLLLEAARNELEAGSRALVLDLAGVSFCSARCLGTLVEVRRLAEEHAATVRVDRPSTKVRRTADLVHAHDVIDGPAPLDAVPGPTGGVPSAGDTRPPQSAAPGTVGYRRGRAHPGPRPPSRQEGLAGDRER